MENVLQFFFLYDFKAFIISADVSLFGTASHSKYLVLVPSTYSHNINCAFHLRFCALAPFQVEKLLDCSNTQQDLPT